MNKSLTKFANKELRDIHNYSKRYNNLVRKNHSVVLLKLMKEHIKEIGSRYKKQDRHYITETGDLLILCFELLKEARVSPDSVLQRCYKRYRNKIPKLISNERGAP